MAQRAVFGLARDQDHAASIVESLRDAGFSSGDISVLMPDRRSTQQFAQEESTKAPEGAAAGALSGGAIGGVLGWLTGIGALAIPGVGPFIAAGPIVAALSGAAVGGAAGGLVGALIGMGIPEHEAKAYESSVKQGQALISVHLTTAEEARRAMNILQLAGADRVGSSGEGTVQSTTTPTPGPATGHTY